EPARGLFRRTEDHHRHHPPGRGDRTHPHRPDVHPRGQDRALGEHGRGGRALQRSHGRGRTCRNRPRTQADRRTHRVRQGRDAVRRRTAPAAGPTGRSPQPRRRRPVRRHHEGNLRMNTFKWLLKREYWEHRGGLFWAPVVTSAIFIFFTIVALLLAALGINQANEMHTGLDISEGIAQLGNPDNQADVSAGLELIFYMLGHPIMIVMAFVGFFYCLSSLYDERKDRSILFWKSLPISDHLTVASKVVTATLIVPLVAVIGASVTALVIMVVLSIFVAA